jgi:hypothetical protein
MKKSVIYTFLMSLLVCGLATAVTLKSWTATETISASDLNTNFSRLNAALPTSTLLLDGVGLVAGASGTLSSNAGTVSSAARTGAGVYTVTTSTTAVGALLSVRVAAAGDHRACNYSISSTTITVRCYDDADVATDTDFAIVVF